MASESGDEQIYRTGQFWLGAASAARRRFEHEAAAVSTHVTALAARLDGVQPADADPLSGTALSLQEEIASARAGLQRACNLGAEFGAAARVPALAVIALICERIFGAPLSRWQILAALGMLEGYAVELGYVNGRPLAVAVSAILQVWCGRHCHIVGASEYLAARDAEALTALYQHCGCSVASIAPTTPEADMATRYLADVLYATGRQLLSDFMRDRLLLGGATSPLRRELRARRRTVGELSPITRGTSVAIIDDIEAVLVDEAASPVLISAAGNYSVLNEATVAARQVALLFTEGRDFEIERQPLLQVHFTADGEQRLQDTCGALPVYWQHPIRRRDVMASALLAREGLERDRHYVVREGRVVLADESVFRLLAGRVWHAGLLQAVEVREGIPLTVPPRNVARAAFQTYFPRYHWLAGAGSELAGLHGELRSCYGLRVMSLVIRAAAMSLTPARMYQFATRAEKLNNFCESVVARHATGRALLIGAPRLTDLIVIGRALGEQGIACHVADGRQPAADAEVLAGVGSLGRVTLITNNAWRNASLPDTDSALDGLLFEHAEMRRNDHALAAWVRQLTCFASLEDDVVTRVLPPWARWLHRLAQQAALRMVLVRWMIALTQGRVHRQGTAYRRTLALRERQLDEQLSFSKKL